MSAAQAALPIRVLSGRFGRKVLVLALALLALVVLYAFWFRDSSLVAVDEVKVEGIGADSPGAAELRRALTEAAGEMTTLHVRAGMLEEVASRFPLVESVSAEPSFPSTLTIRVTERDPAALIGSGPDAIVVGDDGLLLRGLSATAFELPRLPLDEPPRRQRLTATALQQALVLGAAPRALRPHLDGSRQTSQGVVVDLDSGVELQFGNASQAAVKWRAAAAVLADPQLSALDYVDLTAPRRPAVGGGGSLLAPAS